MGVVRKMCTFFLDTYEGTKPLKASERLEIYETIFDYMFYDKEPVSSEVKPSTYLAFRGCKQALDNAKERYDKQEKCGEYGHLGAQYGCLGGRPPKNKPPKQESKTPKNPRGGLEETPKNPQEEEIEEESISVRELNAPAREGEEELDLEGFERFKENHPEVMIDTPFICGINFDLLSEKIAESNFLRNKTLMTFFANHYEQILANGYRDLPKADNKSPPQPPARKKAKLGVVL